MHDMRNAMAIAAQRAGEEKHGTCLGIITGYSPDTYSVKVQLQPLGVETGWIPIKTPWVGNDWGMQAGPTIGDMVKIAFEQGDVNAGVVLGGMFNDEDRPMPVPSGELWIRHKTGATIKLLNDGSLEISSPTALTTSAPVWNHVGPMNVEGPITSTGDMKAGNVSLQAHTHNGVRAGNDNSGPPSA